MELFSRRQFLLASDHCFDRLVSNFPSFLPSFARFKHYSYLDNHHHRQKRDYQVVIVLSPNSKLTLGISYPLPVAPLEQSLSIGISRSFRIHNCTEEKKSAFSTKSTTTTPAANTRATSTRATATTTTTSTPWEKEG